MRTTARSRPSWPRTQKARPPRPVNSSRVAGRLQAGEAVGRAQAAVLADEGGVVLGDEELAGGPADEPGRGLLRGDGAGLEVELVGVVGRDEFPAGVHRGVPADRPGGAAGPGGRAVGGRGRRGTGGGGRGHPGVRAVQAVPVVGVVEEVGVRAAGPEEQGADGDRGGGPGPGPAPHRLGPGAVRAADANRNPGRSQAQPEAAMCAAYGASKVIWFVGIAGEDITDDHVDATSRFLAPGKGLVQMPPASDTDVWAQDARRQYQILSTATTASGSPIAVTKLQGPDYNRIRSTDPNFVASYANCYVCNGAVISAQFGDTTADSAARSTLARLFPGWTVEQLDIDYLGAGGGIHCVTQQQPAV
ncbi:agmatine deiminase family protein [Kitasatospora camelliae]|uniref:Agmatine deiminase family protein n=1 Tax=Kitasatospora camelliae TaxID=3156397 RepID=A0AAU8JPT8_9ACTN